MRLNEITVREQGHPFEGHCFSPWCCWGCPVFYLVLYVKLARQAGASFYKIGDAGFSNIMEVPVNHPKFKSGELRLDLSKFKLILCVHEIHKLYKLILYTK